jgi:hypothetical protein
MMCRTRIAELHCQGLAAAMAMGRLLSLSEPGALSPLHFTFVLPLKEACDPDARSIGVKGFEGCQSVIVRSWSSIQMPNATTTSSDVAHRTMELVLHCSWEPPPTRRLASGVLVLFLSLIRWMRLPASPPCFPAASFCFVLFPHERPFLVLPWLVAPLHVWPFFRSLRLLLFPS